MPGVFISYRRDDSKGYAGALLRELHERVGPELVFMDTEDIVGGTNFPSVLKQAVESAHVLLVLIGTRWLNAADASGQMRLHDTNDFVRQEIVLALQNGIRVIPVLLDGAKMPSTEELPDDLAGLANCNALELANTHWDEDVARLTDHIHEAIYAHGVQNAAFSSIAPTFDAIPPISKNVKRILIFSIGFGLIFAVIAFALMISHALFTKTALQANAEVTGFHESRTGDGGVSYYPELRFVTEDGQIWNWRAKIGSTPPAYEIGERVPILYDPSEPGTASIDSTMGSWGIAMIFAGFGLLWLLIGAIPLVVRLVRKRNYRNLLENGRPIITSFYEVEINGSVTVQGRNPYVIITQWRNPVSQRLVQFRSHQVWEDPTEKAKKRMITVLIDPNNFRHYVMDLSFLHEKAQTKVEYL